MKQERTLSVTATAIGLGIAALIAIIIAANSGSDVQYGNKLTMEYLDYKQINNSDKGKSQIKIFIENSMSMKGYVHKQPGLNLDSMTFESTIGDLVSNLNDNGYNPEWHCGSKQGKTTRELYQNGIGNGSIFSGGDSPLQNYFDQVGKQANDSTITMFVSDLIFSMSGAEMGIDPNAIKSNLPKLQTLVKDAIRPLKKSNIDIMIIQYLSDFNGTYYYNYSNNRVQCAFRNQKMQNRPFYIVTFGKEKELKQLLANKILDKYNKIWVTFAIDNTDLKKQDVTTAYDTDKYNWWHNYHPEGSDTVPFTFWSETDWGQDNSEVMLTFDKKFNIPDYLSQDWTAESSSTAVDKVAKVSDKSVIIKFKKYDLLDKREDISIQFVSNRLDWNENNIDDDILPIDKINDLEKKTWAFSNLMECINEVYPNTNKTDTIGNTSFLLIKQ